MAYFERRVAELGQYPRGALRFDDAALMILKHTSADGGETASAHRGDAQIWLDEFELGELFAERTQGRTRAPRRRRMPSKPCGCHRMSGPLRIHPEIDCHCTDQPWASSSLRSGRALGAARPEPPLFPLEAGPAPT